MSDDPTQNVDPASFGMWILGQLEGMPSRQQHGTAKERMWVVLRELLWAHEVEPPSPEDEEEMRQVLFGVQVPPEKVEEVPPWLRARLRAIEFTDEEIDEFLVLTYCIRCVYDTLEIPPTCGRA